MNGGGQGPTSERQREGRRDVNGAQEIDYPEQSQAALESARSSAPPFEQAATRLSVSVADYDIADVRPLFGEGTA